MVTPNDFAVIGLAPGQTTLHFFLDGQPITLSIAGAPEEGLAVSVTPQPPPD
jgi:hypothetical protein